MSVSVSVCVCVTRRRLQECELVKVVGIKYVIKPPRVASVRLACEGEGEGEREREGEGGRRARSFTVRYHDMPDVIDFLVLRQQYDAATRRRWAQGDRYILLTHFIIIIVILFL